MSNTVSKVTEIVESLLGRKVKEHDGFGTSEDWDSMIQLQLLIKVERFCGQRFSLEQLMGVASLHDWINLAERCEK